MSELGDKQKKFTYMLAKLIIYVYEELGWELTFGDAYRDPRVPYGAKASLHRSRLAADLNLFVDGEYIDGRGTQDETKREYALWERVGIAWEKLGGSWGGRFKSKDLNHLSLAHGGRK